MATEFTPLFACVLSDETSVFVIRFQTSKIPPELKVFGSV
jgi:hypothetical protein